MFKGKSTSVDSLLVGFCIEKFKMAFKSPAIYSISKMLKGKKSPSFHRGNTEGG
jgi:hypothetical protein